jgi:hypothetical protein
MVIMAMTPLNLLSTPGTTVSMNRLIGAPTPLSELNTATLLSTYRVDLSKGSLIGPSLRWEEEQEPEVTVGPLDEKSAHGFYRCLDLLYRQARRLEMDTEERSGRLIRTPDAPHPLAQTTNGEWSSGFGLFGHRFFKGTSGRAIVLETFDDGESTNIGIGVGTSCAESEAILSLGLYASKGTLSVETNFYHFFFQGAALAGLKVLLGLDPASGSERTVSALNERLSDSSGMRADVQGTHDRMTVRLNAPFDGSASGELRFFPLKLELRKLLWARAMGSIMSSGE